MSPGLVLRQTASVSTPRIRVIIPISHRCWEDNGDLGGSASHSAWHRDGPQYTFIHSLIHSFTCPSRPAPPLHRSLTERCGKWGGSPEPAPPQGVLRVTVGNPAGKRSPGVIEQLRSLGFLPGRAGSLTPHPATGDCLLPEVSWGRVALGGRWKQEWRWEFCPGGENAQACLGPQCDFGFELIKSFEHLI